MDDKQSVVITGGSAGIGLKIIEHLLAAGYRVVNLARRVVPLVSPSVINYEMKLFLNKK